MKKKNYIIRINKPCNKGWHNMSEAPTGRFCSTCAKTVTDLSNFSDAEIIKLLEAQPGKICGRFRQSQLNRIMYRPAEPNNRPGLSKMLAGLLLLSSADHVISKTNPIETEISPSVKTNPALENTSENKILPNDSTKNVIRGKVLDAKTKVEAPFVRVVIKNTDKSTITDQNGNFVLIIPKGFTGDSVTIEANELEQKTTRSFSRRMLPVTTTLLLKESEMRLEGDVEIEPVKKKKAKKKK